MAAEGLATLSPAVLRDRIRWVLLARVTIITLFLGAWGISVSEGTPSGSAPIWAIAGLLIVAYAVSLATVGIVAQSTRLRLLAALQVGADVAIISAAIPMTGGLQSPIAVWYNLAILGAAALLARQGAMAAAVLASLAYGTLANFLYYGWLPEEILSWSSPVGDDFGVVYQIGANIASFFSIAFLASRFVERMELSEASLAEARARLEGREEDLEQSRSDLARAEEECQRAVAAWRTADEAFRNAVSEGRDARLRSHIEQEAVAQSLESCVLTVAEDGVIQSAAGMAPSILGRRNEELVGLSLVELLPVLKPHVGPKKALEPGAPPAELAYTAPGAAKESILRCRTVRLDDTYGQPLGSTLYVLQNVPPPAQAPIEAVFPPVPPPSETIVELEGMIGRSAKMSEVAALVRRVAPTASTVLVTGESGTGKELIARAVHSLSPRRDKPLVVVNCAAIPENLLESELFGHVRGAFTGAVSDRKGLLRSADGGTVFLDEIGELPMSLQSKLLRVLQERSFTPVGSTAQVFVDVRIVAATNRDLEASVAGGKFRDDLFYRLNVIRIELAPLRDRREDLPLLIDHFLRYFGDTLGKETPRLSPSALQKLLNYGYPGNVRELENIMEHAVALAGGTTIEEGDLPKSVLNGAGVTPPPAAQRLSPPVTEPTLSPFDAMKARGANLDEELEDYEKRFLNEALRLAGGVRKRAAEILGINYRSLRHRLAKYGYEDRGEGEVQ